MRMLRHKFTKKENLKGTRKNKEREMVMNRFILQGEMVDTLMPINLKSGLLFEKILIRY